MMKEWRAAWDPRQNGILLLGHFHALWKARLLEVELFDNSMLRIPQQHR